MAESEKIFRTISEQRCWQLLRAGTIGRVAWTSPTGPEVLPVTYAVHDDQIVFRTAPYGPLAQLREPQAVVFEIDEFDLDQHSGWSVTARGTSRAASRADELVQLWDNADPVPWAAGTRTLFLVVVPHQVNGRIVGAGSP